MPWAQRGPAAVHAAEAVGGTYPPSSDSASSSLRRPAIFSLELLSRDRSRGGFHLVTLLRLLIHAVVDAAQVGHSDGGSLVLKTYRHLFAGEQRRAADALEAHLG